MIVVNTLGRVNNQPTLLYLKSAELNPVLLVQHHEKDLYDKYDVEVQVLPEHIKNISDTRQWLLENSTHEKVIMIDDDFTFFTREEGVKLRKSSNEDIKEMIENIYHDLETYAAVGISMRQGNNRREEDFVENSAINGLIGLNLGILLKEDIRFDRISLMEDKYVILALLTKGYKNKVWFKWCYNQPASNTEGGCSIYRTPELQKLAAETLATIYPGLVKVKIKSTKTGWFGGDRHDVICFWKKAYSKGLKNVK
jgi:hypothetical protein